MRKMRLVLSGSKSEMISKFRDLVKQRKFSDTKHVSVYDGKKWDKRDTVDHNQTVAYKQCHPYVGHVTVSGRIGLNGKIGGYGTYGD